MNRKVPDILKEEYRTLLVSYISSFLIKKQQESISISFLANDVYKNLELFCLSGKLLRGSLILLILELFKKEISQKVLEIAVAIEFIHSSFLIHDDIMDQDIKRRGNDTTYAQYIQKGKQAGFFNPTHFGVSAGICIGDLGYFLGFELLSSYEDQQISSFCSKEFSKVTLAQLQDVYNGFSEEEISEEMIISVYKYKTGRYTFSVPFIIGGLLVGVKKETLILLETVGEDLGILFQLKDDELGIFGKENVIGKSTGGDIRENKKTLYRMYIFSSVNYEEKTKLKMIFGNKNIDGNDIHFVYEMIRKYDIKNKIEIIWNTYAKKIENDIKNLPIVLQEAFISLITYNKNRGK